MPKATVQITLRVAPEDLERIDDAARAVGMSRSAWVQAACRERYKRQTGKDLSDE